MSAYTIPAEEIDQWAKVRADDAGHLARMFVAERDRHGWQPICTFTPEPLGGSLTAQVMCAHAEKKWVRFGRYDLTLKRWYYSGTNERSQYAQVDGDAPTHWMPLPSQPKP